MNPTVLLALIADLYEQAAAERARADRAENELANIKAEG